MRLINTKTGKEVFIGDEIVSINDEKFIVDSIERPKAFFGYGAIGRIFVKENHDDTVSTGYMPGIFWCRFVND